MYDTELVYSSLMKIQSALERILKRAESTQEADDFLLTPYGMERLESICMLLIAIGESVKKIDKITNKKLFSDYPEIDWKGVMGMRDIIAHHYFDIDAAIVFDVIKNYLPDVKFVIDKILKERLE